jgi:chaperonin GroES
MKTHAKCRVHSYRSSASSADDSITKFQPFFDRVIIERQAPVIPPDKALGNVLKGRVVACGPGYRTEEGKTVPIQVRVGDRVLLREIAGSSKVVFEDNNTKEFYVYRESDIIGKFE